jgi:ABC-type transport system involved in cytochrome c biogenesis permease subunit
VSTHRRRMPFFIFLLGITAIVAGRFPIALVWESLLTTIGAGLVAFAHYQNWRICRSCAVHVTKK